MKRRAALIVCGVDLIVWALLAIIFFLSGSDPAVRDLDVAAGIAVTILFALTAIPAFLLAWSGRAEVLAIGFALAFPMAFVLLFAFGVLLVA